MTRFVTRSLAGWGNFTTESCRLFRPERRSELHAALIDGAQPDYIARGSGRSYGDSAINRDGGVVLGEKLNRFLAFNPATGVLDCEAGVSLAEIIETFLPKGFFLPVTPGTKFVTVGGAIAADVHGKNHHVDGTFSNFVHSLTLMTASGDLLVCTPNGEHADAFWATVGGMGLTGFILTATIRLQPVESAYLRVTYERATNIDEALELFARGNPAHYSVAWIDCLASGEQLGRSVLMSGEHLPRTELPPAFKSSPLTVPRKASKNIPFNFPGWMLSRLTVKTFNHLYYARNKAATRIVDYDAFFYPLDGILHWNRMYGKRGFVQYQALFPPAASRTGLVALLEALSASGIGSFLAVLKSTGPAGRGLLSYPFEGYTLALDLPNKGQRLTALLARLDRIVLDHGGRLYLAKDACMTAEMFATMYPHLPRFLQIKAQLDPENRFASTQAKRLGIVRPA